MVKRRFDHKKLLKRFVIGALLSIIIGLVTVNHLAKKFGYQGIKDFSLNYWSNQKLANSADPVSMEIQLSNSDFDFLEGKREEALERGVQINVGDNYVPCEVLVDNKEVKGEIRLKGHMTDHLEGKKWSFRVKTEERVLGMYRFSLQAPGTRNYAYEWVYHQLLAKEDVIHLYYDFIHLKLRDKDLGVYAIEEHFGQHVLEHNNRPNGAIIRWNPGLYWERRIDELEDIYLDEDYGAYMASYAEPYDKGVVTTKPELVRTYLEGAWLLEAFRRGVLRASEVFDVDRMARFHAIVDLVGGHHSLDWSDVKFFYNADTKRIEPVGYESFSVRKTERIAGQRILNEYGGVEEDYHNRLFSDPIFFKAYIQALEHICDESYFSEFMASIEEDLQEKLAILAAEWPYRQFTFAPYFENIDLIQHNLALPKSFHAFLHESQGSLINLSLAPVSDFPIELLTLEIDNKEKIDLHGFILPAKARETFATYFPLTVVHSTQKLRNLVIRARIPGSKDIFEVEVNEYPSYEQNVQVQPKVLAQKQINLHPNVKFNQHEGVYFFDTMHVKIEEDYFVNKAPLRLLPGQNLNFERGSILVTGTEIQAMGALDHRVVISSQSDTSPIYCIDGALYFSNTLFLGGADFMSLQHSELKMENCTVADFSKTFVKGQFSEITMNFCRFGSVNQIGLLDRSKANLKDIYCSKGEEFVRAYGSYIRLRSADISKFKTSFFLDHISTVKMWGSTLDHNSTIACLENSSELDMIGGDLGSAEVGFILDEKSFSTQDSKFLLYRTKQDRVKLLSQ